MAKKTVDGKLKPVQRSLKPNAAAAHGLFRPKKEANEEANVSRECKPLSSACDAMGLSHACSV